MSLREVRKTQITNVDLLRRAVARMNASEHLTVTGQRALLRLPGAWGMGLQFDLPQGQVAYDQDDRTSQSALGTINQWYGFETAADQVALQGYTLEERWENDQLFGRVVVEA